MNKIYSVRREGFGWIIVDGTKTSEPDSIIYQNKSDALLNAKLQNAEIAAWNSRGLSDAPHADNF